MTLDVHLPAITLGISPLQIDISTQHVLATWLVRGLDESWVTRGEDTIVPSSHGRVSRSRRRDYLTIELQGFAIGYGATPEASLRPILSSLRAIFDPTSAPAALVIGLEDGDEATITARPTNFFMLNYPDPVFRPFSVELEAVGSDWVIATP